MYSPYIIQTDCRAWWFFFHIQWSLFKSTSQEYFLMWTQSMVTSYFEYYNMRDTKDISALPVGRRTFTELLRAFRDLIFPYLSRPQKRSDIIYSRMKINLPNTERTFYCWLQLCHLPFNSKNSFWNIFYGRSETWRGFFEYKIPALKIHMLTNQWVFMNFTLVLFC